MHYPQPEERSTLPSTPPPTGPATDTPAPAGLVPRAVQAVERATGLQYVKTVLQEQQQARTAAQQAAEKEVGEGTTK